MRMRSVGAVQCCGNRRRRSPAAPGHGGRGAVLPSHELPGRRQPRPGLVPDVFGHAGGHRTRSGVPGLRNRGVQRAGRGRLPCGRRDRGRGGERPAARGGGDRPRLGAGVAPRPRRAGGRCRRPAGDAVLPRRGPAGRPGRAAAPDRGRGPAAADRVPARSGRPHRRKSAPDRRDPHGHRSEGRAQRPRSAPAPHPTASSSSTAPPPPRSRPASTPPSASRPTRQPSTRSRPRSPAPASPPCATATTRR